MWIVAVAAAVAATVAYFTRKGRQARAVLADEQGRARDANALDAVRKIAEDYEGNLEAIQRELTGMFDRDEMPECVTSDMGIQTVITTLEQAITDRDMRNRRARIEQTLRKGR